MDAAIAKANATGIGMIAVTNGQHFGAAGYYARMAAERDMIGMAMCNVVPIAVASGSLDRAYGTNPIAFAAPVQDDHPFLLDIATTAVAGGSSKSPPARENPSRPAGPWTRRATTAMIEPSCEKAGRAPQPLGSYVDTSSHKGYGLGLMVDVLTGVLPGMGSAIFEGARMQGQWFAAANRRLPGFRWLQGGHEAHGRPPPRVAAPSRHRGGARPGDPEAAARADRTVNGIPLDAETIDQLNALGEELGIAAPRPLAAS